MKAYRRSLAALGVAAFLPIVVFAAVQIIYSLKRDSQEIRAATLMRDQGLMSQIDAVITADLSALRVMASSSWLDREDWNEYYTRSQRVLRANPHWVTLILSDVRSGETIFNLRKPLGAPSKGVPFDLATLRRADQPVIGGIVSQHEPPAGAYVYLHCPVARQGQVLYVLSLAIDPHVLHEQTKCRTQQHGTNWVFSASLHCLRQPFFQTFGRAMRWHSGPPGAPDPNEFRIERHGRPA